MSARLRTFAALALALVTAAPARAGGDPSSAQSTVQALENLALWCQEHRLYGKRNRACEAMLRVDPENARARHWLRHVRAADGRWKPPLKAAPARDFDTAALVEFGARVEPLLDELRSRAAAAAGDTERRDALELVLALDPDDARARRALGHVVFGDDGADGEKAWVSREADVAWTRRSAMEERLEQVLGPRTGPTRGAPRRQPSPSTPSAAVRATTDARVVASMALEREAGQALQLLAASDVLVRHAAPGSKGLPPATIVHLLAGAEESARFLAACEGLAPAERERLRDRVSFWMPLGSELVVASEDASERLELVVLQGATVQMTRAYGTTPAWGWMFEGLALYASDALLGRAIPFQVADPRAGGWHLFGRRLPCGIELRERAIAALRSGGAPRLRELLDRPAAAMDEEDLVLAHLLVAFLAESSQDGLATVAGRLRRGVTDEQVIAESTGRSLEGLADFLPTWHGEVERIRERCASKGAARAAR